MRRFGSSPAFSSQARPTPTKFSDMVEHQNVSLSHCHGGSVVVLEDDQEDPVGEEKVVEETNEIQTTSIDFQASDQEEIEPERSLKQLQEELEGENNQLDPVVEAEMEKNRGSGGEFRKGASCGGLGGSANVFMGGGGISKHPEVHLQPDSEKGRRVVHTDPVGCGSGGGLGTVAGEPNGEVFEHGGAVSYLIVFAGVYTGDGRGGFAGKDSGGKVSGGYGLRGFAGCMSDVLVGEWKRELFERGGAECSGSSGGPGLLADRIQGGRSGGVLPNEFESSGSHRVLSGFANGEGQGEVTGGGMTRNCNIGGGKPPTGSLKKYTVKMWWRRGNCEGWLFRSWFRRNCDWWRGVACQRSLPEGSKKEVYGRSFNGSLVGLEWKTISEDNIKGNLVNAEMADTAD